MKTIKLNIDDSVFKELQSHMVIKRISESFYGTIDEFLFLIIDSINKKKSEITIETKKKDKKI